MDPGTWPDAYTELAFSGSMCNNLTEFLPDGSVIGDLAESIEPAQNGKVWVFKLKQGITFHNGKSLTSTDVIESYRYHMDKNSKSAAKPLVAAIADIKADGPNGVIFTLQSGNADFPYIASDYHLVIMQAKAGGGLDWTAGIGTGPFSLEKFNAGVSTKMKRNPNYHKENKPYFDEIEILSIGDASARTNALVTGEIHYMDDCDLKTLGRLKTNPKVKILEVKGLGYLTFAMNVTVPPFNNANVRLALKYAIDRDSIVKKVLLGHAVAGNDDPVASITRFATDPQPRFTYDPEKAKFYLKKAGMSSVKVDLSAADAAFTGAVDAALIYKDSAAKAGIDINVVREPNDGYWDTVWMHKPWSAVYWVGRPTCDWLFTQCFAADAAWNDTQWKDPRFNELLAVARSELDDSKRARMYAEMQQILHDDGGTIVMAFNNYVSAVSAQIGYGKVAGNNDIDGIRATERWWFT